MLKTQLTEAQLMPSKASWKWKKTEVPTYNSDSVMCSTKRYTQCSSMGEEDVINY